MSMDPNDPTRRIPPQRPPAERVPADEREAVVAEEEVPALAQLADSVRSLRTALALVGVLALAALGVGLWALLTKEEEDDARQGASRTSVTRLQDRVEQLESDVDDRATKGSVSSLRDDHNELSGQVEELAGQAEDDGGAEQAQQSVEQLRSDIQELEQRLEDVEQEQQQGGQAP